MSFAIDMLDRDRVARLPRVSKEGAQDGFVDVWPFKM